MKKIKMRRFLQDKRHPALDFLKYVGPGLIVAVGFIDPGNWAANLAAMAHITSGLSARK